MDSTPSVLPLTFLVFAVALLLAAWAAWHAQRRWGTAGLLGAWVVGTLILASLHAVRVEHQQAALGFSPAQREALTPFKLVVPMWALALGAQAWLLHRAAAGSTSAFTSRLAWHSILAGFLGILGFFLIYLAVDLTTYFG